MATEKTIDPMSIKETISIPKIPGEEATLFVGLNGVGYQIPRGKSVEVPQPVAEIVRNAEKAREEAEAFREKEKEKANVVQGI